MVYCGKLVMKISSSCDVLGCFYIIFDMNLKMVGYTVLDLLELQSTCLVIHDANTSNIPFFIFLNMC